MRGAFVKTLVELAERDPRILLLTGDLGYLALEPFAQSYPQRFFNMGVAEQNMVGVATGLAEAGFIPFVYSIVPFAVLRPYEFIRNGPILHQFPVRIVGVGGGVEYGINGASHYGLEDVGVMRLQPGIRVIAPADHEQTRSALLASWDLPGPIYYRLGKDDKTTVRGLAGRFDLGRVQLIGGGADLLLVVMGSIASEAVAAAESLAAHNIDSTVMVIADVNPPPMDDLVEVLSHFRLALTIEAHYVVGGIGSMISEVIAERGLDCRMIRCGVDCVPSGITGSLDFMHNTYRLSREALVETSLRVWREVENGAR